MTPQAAPRRADPLHYREWMDTNGVARLYSEPADGFIPSMDGVVWRADTDDDFHLFQFVPGVLDSPLMGAVSLADMGALLESWALKLASARAERDAK